METYGTSFIGGADFGRAVAEALTIKVPGPYNVASGNFTWRKLLETMSRYAGTKADFVIRPSGQPEAGEWRLHQSKFYLDTSAFKTQTGFTPQQSFEELIEEFVLGEHKATPQLG